MKSFNFRIIIIFLIASLISLALNAQWNRRYEVLSRYHRLAFIAGPVVYNKAKLTPQYGDYTFTNKPIWGFNAGLEYDFFPDRKWSLVSGLFLAYEPVFNLEYTIKKEDIYPDYTEDSEGEDKMYANPSFSVPVLAKLNIQAGEKMFLYFISGIKLMYFPPGGATLSVIYRNEDNTEAKEVFGIIADSPDNAIQGSFEIGTGVSIPLKRFLIKSSLIYVINFQNTIEGEYQFGNLYVSPPSSGYYELSGNYLGLMISASLARKKHQKFE